MKGGAAAGFTILETIIVLAVSMGIFVSAATLISGRQRQTAFDTSIRDLQSELQQVVGTVSTGQYSLPDDIHCVATGGITAIKSGSTGGQGSSDGCVFVGKALQFRTGTQDPEQYKIYTMYGLQNFTSSASLDLKTANAKVITPAESAAAVETHNLQYGLHVVSMKYDSSKDVSAMAIVTNTASFGGGDGSQQLNIVPLAGTGNVSTLRDGGSAASSINDRIQDTPQDANPAGGVQICFGSGGTDQSGLMTIGAAGQPGVKLKIFSNGTCS